MLLREQSVSYLFSLHYNIWLKWREDKSVDEISQHTLTTHFIRQEAVTAFIKDVIKGSKDGFTFSDIQKHF